MKHLLIGLLFGILQISGTAADWAVYPGAEGPGKGKHIVLMAGDEEYRSEEGVPMLAKILSQRHGFQCTVLFSVDPAGKTIDPNNQTNVPGMHLLGSADLVVNQFRFRELPDSDMKHFVDYLQAGKPLIAIRTATHAFDYKRNKQSRYAHWHWQGKDWPGGFGQQVLGDTWVTHHGDHGKESTRGLIDGTHATHPVVRGVKDIWGPTDVYGIIRLKPTDVVLVHGLTLKGMKADDAPNYAKSLMPLVWVRDHAWESGKTTRALTSTIGAAADLESEDLRRLFVNSCYWLTGLEVPAKADVGYVGDFKPTFFGGNGYKKGIKPADHELK
jgi:type 1 glutamine amidotransferase